MPNNTFIFLRHAETKVDSNIKISQWILTKKGKKDALKLSQLSVFKDINIIITSDKEKAYQTATPLAEKLKKEIIRDGNLNEIMRDHGKFLKKDEYSKIMKLCMEYRDQSFNNWETANKALERFSKRIQEIDLKYYKKKISIVTHGGVINLYFAKILEQLDKIFERISTNTFCDYGIIQNSKVIIDIAKI